MKRRFIINPGSRGGITGRMIAGLKDFFVRKAGVFDYRIATTRNVAVRVARDALREGVEQLVAVGGDGTINAVANGFFENGQPIRRTSSLAVANLGTGSDYFRSIVAGGRSCDWRELVLRHTVRAVDVGRIRYADGAFGEKYFVNMASVGMIAEVVKRKNRLPHWVPVQLRYVLPAAICFFSCGPTQVEVTVDGSHFGTEVLAISISKGRYAGGGMRFADDVALFDGLLDVTFFQAMRPIEMLLKLGKMYTGAFKKESSVHELAARTLSIKAQSPLAVEFDGELYGTTDIEARVEPKALPIGFPCR